MPLTLQEKILWRARDLLFAPPGRPTAPRPPLVYAGLFRAASGIGEAARTTADALEASGVDVIRADLSATFEQTDLAPIPDASAPGDVATHGRILLLHVNAPETDRALLALRHFRPRRARLIGYWVWETSRAPAGWAAPARRLDLILTPSHHSAEAIAPVVERPVRVAPHVVAPPPGEGTLRETLGLPAAAFIVLAMADGASSLRRKNPLGAIRAFQQAFPDRADAHLLLKIRRAGADATFGEIETAAQRDPRIRLLTDDLDAVARWALLRSCDVFLSLHRAEGFGLPVAEAMALGKPVVATGWSGNRDYMTADNARSIGARLTSVDDPTGRYGADAGQWATPNGDEAAAVLSALAADPALAQSIGAAAAQTIAEKFSPRAVAAAIAAAAFPDQATDEA